MDNATFFDVPILLAASKRSDYRRRIFAIAGCLLKFLEDNQLLLRELRSPNGSIPDSLSIQRTDLTAEGAAVLEEGLDRWLRFTDRGGSSENVSILAKVMKK